MLILELLGLLLSLEIIIISNYFLSFGNLFTFLTSIIASIIAVFMTFDGVFKNNRKEQFKKSYKRLKEEIKDNYEKSKTLNNETERITTLWKEQIGDPNKVIKDDKWIKPKIASFSSWSPYFTHYFPVNEFYYFTNQGFLNEFSLELPQGTQNRIAFFYAACLKFDINSQNLENTINLKIGQYKRKEIEFDELNNEINNSTIILTYLGKMIVGNIKENYDNIHFKEF